MSSEQLRDDPERALLEESIAPQQVAHRTANQQLHIRNHDVTAGYDLMVRLKQYGRSGFRERLYLQPGDTRCLGDLVPAGEWEVGVSIDGKPTTTKWCSIGPNVAETAVIECGNGIVAIRERP
jgi:hypothetical protein